MGKPKNCRVVGCWALLALGCTSYERAVPADGSADGSCLNASPPPATYPSGCPPTLPEPGSCCASIGAACYYATGSDTRRSVAICTDDSVWLLTSTLDRHTCKSATDAIQLGGTAAPLCADRPTVACQACNCPPSDSLCAARCGTTSGGVTPQEQLDSDFADLIRGCGDWPVNGFTFQADFVGGCATSLIAQTVGPAGTYDSLVECIARALDGVHFECADSLDCAILYFSALP